MAQVRHDPDASKGATEQDEPKDRAHVRMHEQLSHREKDPLIKDADTDFPEPGLSPEHSGEPEEHKKTA